MLRMALLWQSFGAFLTRRSFAFKPNAGRVDNGFLVSPGRLDPSQGESRRCIPGPNRPLQSNPELLHVGKPAPVQSGTPDHVSSGRHLPSTPKPGRETARSDT